MEGVVNLRRAKKQRDRALALQKAAENRARFGRTGAERERDEAAASRLADTVDGAYVGPAKPAKDRSSTS